MSDKYILNDQGEPILEPNLLKWGKMFEDTKGRVVAREVVGNLTVSTVFLGLDHRFGKGPPLLWETMVFLNKDLNPRRTKTGKIRPLPEQDMDRCSGSREQALVMHARMVEKIKKTNNKTE